MGYVRYTCEVQCENTHISILKRLQQCRQACWGVTSTTWNQYSERAGGELTLTRIMTRSEAMLESLQPTLTCQSETELTRSRVPYQVHI